MRTTPLELLAGREARLCRRANHYCRRRRVRRLFSVISRLGDGVFWYLLMGSLVVLDGFDGLRASVHMAATGLAALLLYKGLKRWTRRPRPYAADRSKGARAPMAPRVTQVRASPGKATEGPDGGTWQAGERVRRQVGTTLSSIAWSIREQAHGSGIRAERALARGRRPSAEPLVAGRGANSWVWPGGWAPRGTP